MDAATALLCALLMTQHLYKEKPVQSLPCCAGISQGKWDLLSVCGAGLEVRSNEPTAFCPIERDDTCGRWGPVPKLSINAGSLARPSRLSSSFPALHWEGSKPRAASPQGHWRC